MTVQILQTNLNEHEVHKHEIETLADNRTAGNEQKQNGDSHCSEIWENSIHIIADKHLKACWKRKNGLRKKKKTIERAKTHGRDSNVALRWWLREAANDQRSKTKIPETGDWFIGTIHQYDEARSAMETPAEERNVNTRTVAAIKPKISAGNNQRSSTIQSPTASEQRNYVIKRTKNMTVT